MIKDKSAHEKYLNNKTSTLKETKALYLTLKNAPYGYRRKSTFSLCLLKHQPHTYNLLPPSPRKK